NRSAHEVMVFDLKMVRGEEHEHRLAVAYAVQEHVELPLWYRGADDWRPIEEYQVEPVIGIAVGGKGDAVEVGLGFGLIDAPRVTKKKISAPLMDKRRPEISAPDAKSCFRSVVCL